MPFDAVNVMRNVPSAVGVPLRMPALNVTPPGSARGGDTRRGSPGWGYGERASHSLGKGRAARAGYDRSLSWADGQREILHCVGQDAVRRGERYGERARSEEH